MSGHRARARRAGYTLLEVMVVLTIVVGLIAVAGASVRRLRRSDLRTAATTLGGAMRYTYDRAAATGKYYRLVIDLDEKRFWPEVSDERFYLVRDRDRGRRAPEDEDEETGADEAAPSSGGGLLGGLLGGGGGEAAPPKVGAAKARFSAASERGKRATPPLRGVTISAVWTPRHEEPVTSGRAYLYFFPEGMGERAIVHLEDDAGAVYSLVQHPLTGRVEVVADRVEIPRGGTDRDDEGQER